MRATKSILTEEGQTIYDIALQYYGNFEAAALLVLNNNLGFDSVLPKAFPLIIQNNPVINPDQVEQGNTYQNQSIKIDFDKKNIRINTGDIWQDESAFDFSFTIEYE